MVRTRRLIPGLSCLAAAVVLSACGGGDDATRASNASQAAPSASISLTDKHILAGPAIFEANGWYWNPDESGTGFMFEAQGTRGFVGFFMYEEGSGNPIWYVAYGDVVAGAGPGQFNFSGSLSVASGGQPVGSANYTSATPSLVSVGTVMIAFAGQRATVALPGGRIMAAQRYPIDGSGVDLSKPVITRPEQPEVGWYWNPIEGGRGYAIEVQNDRFFMAVFHYNLDGSPTWNLVQGDIATGSAVEPLQMTSGGQSLTSAYRGGVRDLLGPFTLSFRSPCAGQLQLFGAPPITVRRFVIDGSTQPPGSECRSLATLADLPGNPLTPASLAPGEAIYGRIDSLDDADDFRIQLVAGASYTFDLLGASSRAGTLPDPRLRLLGADLALLAENDNREAGLREARITFTASYSGPHYLRAFARDGGTGSYLLTASGTAPVIHLPVISASPPEGKVAGRLRGARPGDVSLAVGPAGGVSGSFLPDDAGGVPIGLSGSLGANGVIRFQGGDGIQCIGLLSGESASAACGRSGMVAGQWTPAVTRVAEVVGRVQGLGSGEQVTLLLDGASPLLVTGTGARESLSFRFATPLPLGQTYRVTAVPVTGLGLSCGVDPGIAAVADEATPVVVNCSSGRSDTFGNGLRRVGLEVVPGLYRSNGGPDANCYWERRSDTSDQFEGILANDLGPGTRLVQILSTDMAFHSSSRCGPWTRVAGPVTARPDAPFLDGQYVVGVDLHPGLWRSSAMTSSCYWARLANLAGEDEILANDIGSGPRVVEILATDAGFESSRCGPWKRATGAVTVSQQAPFTDGVYLVGVDIQPGLWRSDGASSGCYWARLRNLAGTQDIIDNNFGQAPAAVLIGAADVAFEASGCGTWQLVP